MQVKEARKRVCPEMRSLHVLQAFLLTLTGCFFYSITISQTSFPHARNNIILKGKIVDSLNQNILSSVDVVIHDLERNKILFRTFSTKQGFFKLNVPGKKQYQINFSHVGYQTKTMFLSSLVSAITDLGNITLTTVSNNLKEVQVLTQKPLMEQDGEKLMYNVDADPESKTSTAMDMLNKIPFLTLDADDNLQLNGSDNYQILINGKSSTLFLRNQSNLFRNLSASAIKTIEVITVPSAKYEAKGVGGIINIITYKKSIGGYTGGINLQASKPGGTFTNGNLSTSVGKITFSGNLGYNTNTTPTSSTTFYRHDKNSQSRLEQKGYSNSNYGFKNVGGELNFELNSNNIITAGYSLNRGNSVNSFNQHVIFSNLLGEPGQTYNRYNVTKGNQYGNDFNLDYQHTFKKNEARQLSLSYKWSNSINGNAADFILEPLLNFKGGGSITNNDDEFSERIIQADYLHPIKKHSLEMGISSIFRKTSSDYFYKNQDTLTGAFLLDSSQSNVFHYTENINAAYTSLNLKMGKWGLRLGARLEQAKINARFISSRTFAVNRYLSLIPNITLSLKLKEISMIKFSYAHRLNRPNLDYLNPYVDLTDPWNISYGNPHLRPSLAHLLNLSYNTFINKTSFNINFSHQFTNNSIQQFTTLGTDTISRTTFGNIGQNRNSNLTANANATIFKKLNISLGGNASYLQYVSSINGKAYASNGFTYSASGTANLRLKAFGVSSSLNYNSPNILVQGRTSGYISNSITLNKYFLKNNKANISLSVTSPFLKHRHTFTEINDPVFHMIRESYNLIRRYNLSVNYRFSKIQGTSSSKK
jgi:outer membrane receptor protein involved in Fe transport